MTVFAPLRLRERERRKRRKRRKETKTQNFFGQHYREENKNRFVCPPAQQEGTYLEERLLLEEEARTLAASSNVFLNSR